MDSALLRKQEQILEGLSSDSPNSKAKREFLISKFSGLLREMAKSVPGKRAKEENQLLSERLQPTLSFIREKKPLTLADSPDRSP